MGAPQIHTLVAFTADPWGSVLPILRYRRAAEIAGLEIIRGNDGDRVFPERVSQGDLLLIQRDFPRFTEAYEAVVVRARREGKPVIYEVDDLLLELPEGHVSRSSLEDVLFPVLRAAAEADAVTASTPALCEYYRPLNPNTWLVPNYLDDRLWSFRDPPKGEPSPLVIGYMGGQTHLPDLEFVAPVLLKVLEVYGERVRLRFWGGKPPQILLNSPGVEWISLEQNDYAQFARFFGEQEAHIFIAPLRDHLFNRCKSAIKFLEYAALGVPGIYSQIPAYEEIVEPGANGYLASTLEEWEQRLCSLIESPEKRREMGLHAQQTARENWLLSPHAGQWLEIYQRALELPRNSPDARSPQIATLLSVARQAEARQRQLEGRIADMGAMVHDRDLKILSLEEQLAAAENQLRDITHSRGWQLLQKIQAFRQRLIPLGSRREKLLRSFWK